MECQYEILAKLSDEGAAVDRNTLQVATLGLEQENDPHGVLKGTVTVESLWEHCSKVPICDSNEFNPHRPSNNVLVILPRDGEQSRSQKKLAEERAIRGHKGYKTDQVSAAAALDLRSNTPFSFWESSEEAAYPTLRVLYNPRTRHRCLGGNVGPLGPSINRRKLRAAST